MICIKFFQKWNWTGELSLVERVGGEEAWGDMAERMNRVEKADGRAVIPAEQTLMWPARTGCLTASLAREMTTAARRPLNTEELLEVSCVGRHKMGSYGAEFLRATGEFFEEQDWQRQE